MAECVGEQISQELSFNSLIPSCSIHPSVRHTGVRVVSSYRLSAGSFVCVGLNERGKRHFPLLSSCLLDGSPLGSSGQTAHSLIAGPFLGSFAGRPLIHVDEWDRGNWVLCLVTVLRTFRLIARYSVIVWEHGRTERSLSTKSLRPQRKLLTYWHPLSSVKNDQYLTYSSLLFSICLLLLRNSAFISQCSVWYLPVYHKTLRIYNMLLFLR